MRLELQILIAFALDLLFGDPRWLPHPVKLIGRFALALEAPCRRVFSGSAGFQPANEGGQDGRAPRAYLAGATAVLIVVSITGAVAFGLVYGAAQLHPFAGDALAIFLIYTALAARDLADHSRNVYEALAQNDVPAARRRVALIVGRDTDKLDEAGVARAAAESVAESMVDGVTAPLFFAVIGGPVGALIYKAINTLDSTFGYKSERYLQFGWAAARLDDLANYLPARLTAPLVALAAALIRLRPFDSLRILLRDGRKHESPNAGLAEAAVAGALGVQFGGLNFYEGEACERPRMGDPGEQVTRAHILSANALMFLTAALALGLFVGARWAILEWGWRL